MPEDQGTVAGGVLSSWKQVAAHLGVTVRSAQLWEKQRGLPVRRLPGPRSRIEADPAALERWKAQHTATDAPISGVPAIAPVVVPQPRSFRLPLLGVGVLLVLAVLGFWARPSRVPAGLQIERNALVVLDRDGVVLWRKEFPYLLSRAAYAGENAGRYAWFGDLDGDGHTEVLLVPQPIEDTGLARPLICYSDRGVERWRYTPTRAVRTRVESFSPVYTTSYFLPVRARSGRPGAVFVSSLQETYYPCQIARLTTDGVLQREYWHSGYLNHLALGQDHGRDVLYAAGVSNAWKAATLVLLDPERFRGVSQEPEAPDYQLLGMPSGEERARVILPRSTLNEAVHVYNSVVHLVVRPGAIIVTTEEDPGTAPGAGILHEFSLDLTAHTATLSDQYQAIHRRLEAIGALHHPITATERAGLDHVRIIPGHH